MVERILDDLGVSDKPRILVLNKVDLLDDETGSDGEYAASVDRLIADAESRAVFTSAQTGSGLRPLLNEIDAALSAAEDAPDLSDLQAVSYATPTQAQR